MPLSDSSTPSQPATATEPDSQARDDWQLVQGVLRGDPEALRRFEVRIRCIPRILSALNARLGRRLGDHDIADLAQDVLVVLWRKLEDFYEGAPIEAWIYRIARLELMNALRRLRRDPVRAVEDPTSEIAGNQVAARRSSELREELLRALERVGRPAADVVRLKAYDSLTFPEIGAKLAMSPNTAKAHYYRSLPILQQVLRERFAGAQP